MRDRLPRPRFGCWQLSPSPAVAFDHARNHIFRNVIVLALIELRDGRLDQRAHRRGKTYDGGDAEISEIARGSIVVVFQKDSDVSVDEVAGAVKQMFAPGRRIIPQVADLAH